MSTHPYSEHDDLDRTDELPRLDVAEYEAQLAGQVSDMLESTGTWSTEALREEETKQLDTVAVHFPRTRIQPPDPPKSADVTLDATRIFERIEQLELEFAAAQQREAELQARFDSQSRDLAAKEKETRGLSSDNARLSEQRSIVIERVRALEQQIKDETAQFERELTQQRELRTSENTAATTARLALEQQLSELKAFAERLREDNARLSDETVASAKLVKTQMEVIEQFKLRLGSEEKNSSQLARHLAAKIADHATADQELARRDALIRGLADARDDLARLLEEARGRNESLTARLTDLTDRIAASDSTLQARDETLAQRDTRIAQLEREVNNRQQAIAAAMKEEEELLRTLADERESQSHVQQALSQRAKEIDQLRDSGEQLQLQIASLQQQLSIEQRAHGDKHNKVGELEHALTESHSRCDILASEVESARTRIKHLEVQAMQAAAAQEALQAYSGKLELSHDELSAVQRELDEVRTSLVTKHSELAEREQALETAQEIIAEMRNVNQKLETTLETHQQRLSELEARDREREAGVLAQAADLAAARRQLSQQLAAVQSMEQALRARDTLSERLRSELQMTQDERAIMQGQLEKSRNRNRSMAREIFARDGQIATLKADLAVHVETLAAIRQDVNRTSAAEGSEHPERTLEPVGHDGEVIVLNRKMMTIGRTSDNDICIPSKLVSRNHARLLIGPNAVIVEDAGSTNGCLVNEVRVKQHLMREGDVLAIGDLKYRLRTHDEDAVAIRDNVIPFGEGRHTD